MAEVVIIMMWWDERGARLGSWNGKAMEPAMEEEEKTSPGRKVAIIDLDCEYTRQAVLGCFRRDKDRRWRTLVKPTTGDSTIKKGSHDYDDDLDDEVGACLYWGEYERVDWEAVGMGRIAANCYCIRKGLIRKAQLALAVHKWRSKRPDSLLAKRVPETHVFELYDIEYFDEVLIADVPELREMSPGEAWILKPNITNQALGVRVFDDLGTLRQILSSEEAWNLREWVVQRYVDRPLLVGGRKFHVRTYVLAVGAAPMRVLVYDQMLALFAADAYPAAGEGGRPRDISNLDAHLTNTCRITRQKLGGGMTPEEEATHVRLLDEISGELGGPAGLRRVKDEIGALVAECLDAVSSDLSFMPMANCFELFGFDFLVDRDGGAWLLEANAEPDLVQSGRRLGEVIEEMVAGVYVEAVVPLTAAEEEEEGWEETKTTQWKQVLQKTFAGSQAMGFHIG